MDTVPRLPSKMTPMLARVLLFFITDGCECYPHRFTSGLVLVYVALSPFNTHIKTARQRTIIQQYSDWYTGR